jgi:dolichyl-phosphate beta-glucosyltransferase
VTRPWLSVVIPAYNEERAIAATVRAARAALEPLDRPYELIVVDNASEDRTAGLAREAGAQVLVNDANRGKGFSVKRGMLAASGDLRLHCDADCTTSFASLPKMLALLDHCDVVVGSRLAAGADVGRRQPLRRRIMGRSFVDLCRLVLREPTRDLFCGFKLWRAHAAVEAYSRTRLDGWTYDAETLAMARALGFRVRETGIVWSDREGSRLDMARIFVPVIRELLAARRHVSAESRLRLAEPDLPAQARPAADQRP